MITIPVPRFSQSEWMRQVDDVTLSVDGLGDYDAMLTWNLHGYCAEQAIGQGLCQSGLAYTKI